MTIQEVFEKSEGAITYDEFVKAAGSAKFVDLDEGQYVSKRKYEDELSGKDKEIETLNGNMTARDEDLKKLQEQLEAAGTDAEKLSTLSGELDSLKSKYDSEVKEYQKQLKQQAYEFAVKEFAGSKKFTSAAAKRDFERSMISESLKMKDGSILGAEDFVKVYSESNADAFVKEEPQDAPKPSFAAPTQGTEPPTESKNSFVNAFHFAGVRSGNETPGNGNLYVSPQ